MTAPGPIQDAWVQIFLALALISGLLTAYGVIARMREPFRSPWEQASIAPPAGSPAARPASPLAAPESGGAFRSETSRYDPGAVRHPISAPLFDYGGPPGVAADGGQPAAVLGGSPGPRLSGAGISRRITAATPGRWVVDAGKGPGSDTESLADAIFSAKDGDVIALRSGTYPAGFSIERSVVISGPPPGQAPAVLRADTPPGLVIAAGKALITDLSIVGDVAGGPPGTAVAVGGGRLRLERVKIRVSDAVLAIKVEAGELTALDCEFEQGEGQVMVMGAGSKAEISQTSFKSPRTFGVTAAHEASLRLTNVTVSGSRHGGLLAWGGAMVRVSGGSIADNAACGIETHAADIRLEKTVVTGNACGILAMEDSRLSLPGAVLKPNRRGSVVRDDPSLSVVRKLFPDVPLAARAVGSPRSPARRSFGRYDIFSADPAGKRR